MQRATLSRFNVLAWTPQRLVEKLRRPTTWAALVGTTVLVAWAALAGAAIRPMPLMSLSQAGWQHIDAATIQFAHPEGWTVAPLDGEGYRLTPLGHANGTHISIAYLPASAQHLADVERLGVARVERDETITRHYLRIVSRTRMADRAAARVRYTADLASGQRVRGLWTAATLPDGRVLAVTLEAHPGTHFKTVEAVYRRLLQSVKPTR